MDTVLDRLNVTSTRVTLENVTTGAINFSNASGSGILEFYTLTNILMTYNNGTEIQVIGSNQNINITLTPSQYIQITTIAINSECSSFDRAGYEIIRIAGALLLLGGVIFYLYRKGREGEITVGILIIAFIIISVGIAFIIAIADNIALSCVS